jgi:hypothetical protein
VGLKFYNLERREINHHTGDVQSNQRSQPAHPKTVDKLLLVAGRMFGRQEVGPRF